jgi:predicted ATP-dependent serine protease
MAVIDEIVKEHTGIAIEAKSVFKVNSANRWMQEAAARPTPKKLFGGLWVEGELSILYADTGIGKTILAVQIADNISSGKELLPFENETEAQKILYVDFELTDKQFQMRYTDKETMKMHHFSDNFLRAEISFDDEVSEEMIMQAIENEILTKQVKVLIVDNITYLNGETEKGRHALPLMKQLNQLKKQYGLSILVLAHTPKRDESRPIILNDLYGSKMISNFIDGAFAIGRSNEAQNLRYIKQVKCRSSEMEYFSENVILVELVKSDCMIHFEFVDFSNEALHLKQFSQSEDSELTNKIFELSGQGYTQRKIADEIGRSVGYVNKFLKHKKQ